MMTAVQKRNRNYPAATLKQAIDFAIILSVECGRGPYSRRDTAQKLGYSEVSGMLSARLAACVHFGILSNNGSGYRLTRLGERLSRSYDGHSPTDLVEAVMNPHLYNTLIREFSGRSLPSDFENYLIRSYNVKPEVAPRAARNFFNSITFAGVFDNGVITLESHSLSRPATSSRLEDNPESTSPQTQSPSSMAQPSRIPALAPKEETIELVLPDTDVVVIFPKRYAYSLSIGKFSDGIKTLRDSIIESTTDGQKGGYM